MAEPAAPADPSSPCAAARAETGHLGGDRQPRGRIARHAAAACLRKETQHARLRALG